MTIKVREIYEKETGNKAPSNTIAYHEWYLEYVSWLERKVKELYNLSKRK